jgi:hypothetical protein
MTPEDEEYLKGRVAFLESAVLELLSEDSDRTIDRETWSEWMLSKIRENHQRELPGRLERDAARARSGACAVIRGRSTINEWDEKRVDDLFANAFRRSGRRNLKPESD